MIAGEDSSKDPVELLRESIDKMHLASCAIVKHLFHLEETEKKSSKNKVRNRSVSHMCPEK